MGFLGVLRGRGRGKGGIKKLLLTIIADEDQDVVISALPPAAAIDTDRANSGGLCHADRRGIMGIVGSCERTHA